MRLLLSSFVASLGARVMLLHSVKIILTRTELFRFQGPLAFLKS